MKKKRASKSELSLSDAGQTPDYVVGLVSDSLGSGGGAAAVGSLCSLFSPAVCQSALRFIPAPKVVPQTSSQNEQLKQKPVSQSDEKTAKVKKPVKKPERVKTSAEIRLQERESALQTADDVEEVKNTAKKVKRKVEESKASSDSPPAKRQKAPWNPAEERIKLKRTVFVGNLPINFTKKGVKKLFKDLGTIESVRFRSVLREDPTMSRRLATIRRQAKPNKQSINAYVVFKDQEGAVNALKRNGMEIQKEVFIRVDRVSQHGSHDHKRSVFVGNLPYDIKEIPFRQHFEDCGTIEAVRLVRDRNTGDGKGFGYVLFENSDSVTLALNLNDSELMNRQIRVKRSVKKEKNDKNPARKDAKQRTRPHPGKFPPSKMAKGTNTNPTSFKGIMSDQISTKAKGHKKKFKPRKSKLAHI